MTIQTPPSLTLTVGASPSPVLEGAAITVTVTVQNGGQATASAVVPTLGTSGTGTAALVSGPTPPQASIAGGGMQTFTWQYAAGSPGSVTFTAGAGGQDANSGVAVSAPIGSTTITVVKHAALSVGWSVPANVAAGGSITATMTVTNSGGNAAVTIAPTTLTLGGTATATLVSGPTPTSTPGPLAPGNMTTFTWVYTAGATAGTVTFTGGANGQDATDASAISSGPVTSSPVTIGNPAALTATLAIPPSLTRGATFTATMVVHDVGGNAATAVTPSTPAASGSAAVMLQSGPTPPSATIAAGGSATFTWTYVSTLNGTLQLAGSVAGSDAMTGLPVSATATSNSAVVEDLGVIATDPFGDGTSFTFVFAYDNLVYLGPRGNGAGAVRMNPDGSTPQSVSFATPRDTSGHAMANSSTPPYPSLGSVGCAANTSQCGPDNENGRGLFTAGTIGSTQWLLAGGGTSGGNDNYVYMTNGTTTALTFDYVDLSGTLEGGTRSLTAAHVFNGSPYFGFSDTGGNRPILIRLETLPSAPGLNANGGDVTDMQADNMSGVKASAMSLIDVIGDFDNRLYFANNGAWYRSTNATPNPWTLLFPDWSNVTPSSSDYGALTSVTTTKSSDYEPADRAVPAFATFNGRYYAARNTTAGPQLWVCTPAKSGSNTDCDSGDWSLIARNTLGNTELSQFNDAGNVSVSLLVATSGHLYVGFNDANGLQVWRSSVTQPTQQSDFEGDNGCSASLHSTGCLSLGGPGIGDPTNNQRIFSGIAATFNAQDNVYFVAGNGANAVRVVRIAE
ncbi:MAG TPA: CARDB domain-containing protein [Polyangia bacterium]